jgi:hypothetical protein
MTLETMKKTLFLFLSTIISLSNVTAQQASYSFTSGSLTGLTHFGTALTTSVDRINAPTNAVDLNGDYLRSTYTSNGASLTLSFWIKTTTVNGAKKVIIEQSARNSTFDNASDVGWYTYLKNGKVGLAANYWHTHDVNNVPVVSQSGYYYTEGTTNIADGYWHNVIVTAQKSTYYLNGWNKRYVYVIYIDGIQEGTQTIDRGAGSSSSNINASLVPNAKALTIANNGSSNLTDRYLDEIDDIRYYSSVVNAATINTLANENRCTTPQNIAISAITSNSANVTWTQNTEAISWELMYVQTGQPINTATTISGITTNSYSLTGLNQTTSYDVYLKSNCTGFSGWWSIEHPFTTLCPSSFAQAIAQNVSVQLNSTGNGSITTSQVNNGSTVDCGILTLALSKTDFDCSNVGANTVTLTATDNQGHISTATAIVTVIGNINDETLTASQTSFCGGSNVTITTSSSMVGFKYSLRNDATNTVIGSPINGTGSALTFNTGILNSTQTFNVLAEPISNQYALDFDGTNDHVKTNVPMISTPTFTVESWIFPRSANYDRIISNYAGANTNGHIIFDTYDVNNNGKALRFNVYSGSNTLFTTTASNVLTLNTWNHVAATFENGVVKLYVNGVLKTTATAPFTTIAASSDPFVFGEDNTIGTLEYLNGKLDEIRFWTTARSITEISSNMNNCLEGNESGLYAYFKFSEGTGTTLTDLVNNNVGTLTNMDGATDWITGQVNCSKICSFEMSQLVTVTVFDNLAPVPTITNLAPINAQCSVTSLTIPTALDNCIGTVNGTHAITLPLTSSTTITWTYNDGHGNTSTQTQNVIIADNIAPVPVNSTLSPITSQCAITSLTAPTALDNCAGTIVGTHAISFPISSNTTITWSYNDGHGNISTQTQNVLVNDNIAPIPSISTLPILTSQCPITTLTAPTALDNCTGLITGIANGTLPFTTNTTITWMYVDGHGNASSQAQQVVINDNTAPIANVNSLPTITSQCAITSLTAPTASDNCVGTVTGTTNVILPITSSTTITWNYSDGHGNTSSQTQLIVVNDNISPVPTLTQLPIITDQCSVNSLTPPTASDNCSGTIIGTTTVILPIITSTTVAWSFDDGHGNISTQTQQIVINDITAPVVSNVSLPTLNDQCSISSLVIPTASDNCVGTINGTHTITLPITSSTTITWTFNDGHGNISTQTQSVIIEDNIAPVSNTILLSDVTSECEITTLVAPTATDNCSGTITGTTNVSFPIVSDMVVTWTFDDGHGNLATELQNIFITGINTTTVVNNNVISANLISGNTYQWIDCNNGNSPISGETSNVFTPQINGNYAVEISNGTCSSISNCVSIQSVGLEKINTTSFNIYPNPTISTLIIQTTEEVLYNICSMRGDLILTGDEKEIDVQNLEPGMYMIQIETSTGIFIDKFVKK